MKQVFTKNLMHWHQISNHRQMPWKGEKDAYKIWLSEIILQQTRVEQGWNYYERFINNYPNIGALAAAKDQDVFKLWEGLGYYNRCKNLLHTARTIVNEYDGQFPNDYETILSLKGIGPYTAAAIASFAFQLPYAVVDGNVFRVLSRYFNIADAIDGTAGKMRVTQLAQEVLDQSQPGIYNQAIMDFGATVCKPFAPSCSICPLQKNCQAFANGLVNELPVKEKKLLKRKRWFNYFFFEHGTQIYIHQRAQGDIWANLHEFYLVESPDQVVWNNASVMELLQDQLGIQTGVVKEVSDLLVQQLTHQQIKARFIQVVLTKKPALLTKGQWVDKKLINQLAFPKIILQWMENAAPLKV
jgi:A/G-specific adenine glycosylase